jgi:hypothetical protein
VLRLEKAGGLGGWPELVELACILPET